MPDWRLKVIGGVADGADSNWMFLERVHVSDYTWCAPHRFHLAIKKVFSAAVAMVEMQHLWGLLKQVTITMNKRFARDVVADLSEMLDDADGWSPGSAKIFWAQQRWLTVQRPLTVLTRNFRGIIAYYHICMVSELSGSAEMHMCWSVLKSMDFATMVLAAVWSDVTASLMPILRNLDRANVPKGDLEAARIDALHVVDAVKKKVEGIKKSFHTGAFGVPQRERMQERSFLEDFLNVTHYSSLERLQGGGKFELGGPKMEPICQPRQRKKQKPQPVPLSERVPKKCNLMTMVCQCKKCASRRKRKMWPSVQEEFLEQVFKEDVLGFDDYEYNRKLVQDPREVHQVVRDSEEELKNVWIREEVVVPADEAIHETMVVHEDEAVHEPRVLDGEEAVHESIAIDERKAMREPIVVEDGDEDRGRVVSGVVAPGVKNRKRPQITDDQSQIHGTPYGSEEENDEWNDGSRHKKDATQKRINRSALKPGEQECVGRPTAKKSATRKQVAKKQAAKKLLVKQPGRGEMVPANAAPVPAADGDSDRVFPTEAQKRKAMPAFTGVVPNWDGAPEFYDGHPGIRGMESLHLDLGWSDAEFSSKVMPALSIGIDSLVSSVGFINHYLGNVFSEEVWYSLFDLSVYTADVENNVEGRNAVARWNVERRRAFDSICDIRGCNQLIGAYDWWVKYYHTRAVKEWCQKGLDQSNRDVWTSVLTWSMSGPEDLRIRPSEIIPLLASQAESLIHEYVCVPSVSQLDRDLMRYFELRDKRSGLEETLMTELSAGIANIDEFGGKNHKIEECVTDRDDGIGVEASGMLHEVCTHCKENRLLSGREWRRRKAVFPQPKAFEKPGGRERAGHTIREVHMKLHKDSVKKRIDRIGVDEIENCQSCLQKEIYENHFTEQYAEAFSSRVETVLQMGMERKNGQVDLRARGSLVVKLCNLVGWQFDIRYRDILVKAAMSDEMMLRKHFRLGPSKYRRWDDVKRCYVKVNEQRETAKKRRERERNMDMKTIYVAVEKIIKEWNTAIDHHRVVGLAQYERAGYVEYSDEFWLWMQNKATSSSELQNSKHVHQLPQPRVEADLRLASQGVEAEGSIVWKPGEEPQRIRDEASAYSEDLECQASVDRSMASGETSLVMSSQDEIVDL